MEKSIILMATYNGGEYIRKQLDSIINQDYKNWELCISDNGSSDDTMSILQEYKEKEPRITNIYVNNESKGAFNNYHFLVKKVKELPLADYYFYCDQDDIWKSNKMSLSIRVLKRMEKKYGKMPLFCYSDLEFIDDSDNLTGERFSDNTDIRLDNPYNLFFAHRYIWGTTMAHNGELFKLIRIPDDICEDISHDNYIGKHAVTYGKIAYINTPTVLYRRHGDNVSSLPVKYGIASGIIRAFTKFGEVNYNFAKVFWASQYFVKNAPMKNEFLTDLDDCINKSGLSAVRFIRKYHVNYKGSIYNKMAFLLILVLGLYKNTEWFKK